MIEKLAANGPLAVIVAALVAAFVAILRYGIPGLLALIAISKGRRALIRSTKAGLEVITDPAADDGEAQGLVVPVVRVVETEAPALHEKTTKRIGKSRRTNPAVPAAGDKSS